ncbi:sphingomyelin phosphodiesterase-like isoform X2 [Photinus pyralis]|nr:sphingomyelin phosphodiesterase-like isoform X2 [Photinus pyralis]
MSINGSTSNENLANRIQEFYYAKNATERNQWSCNICRLVANKGISLQQLGGDKKQICKFASDMCDLFLPNDALQCNRYVDNLIDSWMYIVENKPEIKAESVCRIRMQDKNCFPDSEVNWEINIPKGESRALSTAANNKVQYKVLHLTDIHYDPLYKVGANAVCKDVLCCESISGTPNAPNEAAGYWGDYHVCDMPWYSIDDLMEQLSQHNFSWVYLTGDLIGHQIAATSPRINSDIIKKISQKLRDTLKNVPVYPILGNHEPNPVDAFSPEIVTKSTVSTQWLLNVVAEEWAYWLGPDAKTTIRKGGYYSTVIRPGLRVIALNSNVCFTNNIWLFYEEGDVFGQLQWLANTLLEAERRNEAVHILAHVPAGEPTCLKKWNHGYRQIINRFHNTITAQFNGHTHADGLKIFYDSKKQNEVINVAFNGGSFTTFVGNNPNYKIYDIEGRHGHVSNYKVWMYDLSEANKSGKKPKWFQLYSFRETFQIDKLNQEGFHELVKKLGSNKQMLETYRRFRSRNGTASLTRCDVNCLRSLYCEITQTEHEESAQCGQWFKIQ